MRHFSSAETRLACYPRVYEQFHRGRSILRKDDSFEIGYCGVCCEHCGMRERIPKMAIELKTFVDAYGYSEWIENVNSGFDFQSFIAGLKWFASSNCVGCSKGGGMPKCSIRDCCSEKNLRNCYFCPRFVSCGKNQYQKLTYRIGDHYAQIARIGYGKWLAEQKRRDKSGFDNIEYLEKKK
jgi:hypothetical protein